MAWSYKIIEISTPNLDSIGVEYVIYKNNDIVVRNRLLLDVSEIINLSNEEMRQLAIDGVSAYMQKIIDSRRVKTVLSELINNQEEWQIED